MKGQDTKLYTSTFSFKENHFIKRDYSLRSSPEMKPETPDGFANPFGSKGEAAKINTSTL